MSKIIILNAPPGAGKDTIGKLIAENAKVETRFISFKNPMFEIALAMLGKTGYADFISRYNDRETKEQPCLLIGGELHSPRQFMIWISEQVMKPSFGHDYFGERFAHDASENEIPVICTDGGFEDEIYPLLNAGHEVKLCRLHRRGYSFDGDSRDYVYLPLKYHGANYSEADFHLVDNKPEITARNICDLYLK